MLIGELRDGGNGGLVVVDAEVVDSSAVSQVFSAFLAYHLGLAIFIDLLQHSLQRGFRTEPLSGAMPIWDKNLI